jgi:hypothetical protein
MLTEGSPNWSGRENLHNVKSYGHALGVTCADWGLCERCCLSLRVLDWCRPFVR